MTKASNLLFTAAFAIGCLGLWYVVWILEGIYIPHFRGMSILPVATQLLFTKKLMFLFAPLPFVCFCAFTLLRKPLTIEATLCYIGVMTLTFMILVLLTTAVALLPFIPSSML